MEDIKSYRAALFGYKLQFSPETQPIRHTVVDHIILRNLYDSHEENGETVGKINFLEFKNVQVIVLTIDETKASLERMKNDDLVDNLSIKKKVHWVITEKGKKYILENEKQSIYKLNRVVNDLFSNQPDELKYYDCFVDCLCRIFDRLAQEYIEITFSHDRNIKIMTPQAVEPMIIQSLELYQNVNGEFFRAGIQQFFKESNPDYNTIKWTFCKNHYLVRAIGLGPQSDILSSRIFENSLFYLDTNIIIPALDSNSIHHKAVNQIIDSLRKINCKIYILSITINELNELIEKQSENLEDILSQIPNGLIKHVSGIAARAESKHRANFKNPTVKEVLIKYEDVENYIKEELDIDTVNDYWFETERNNKKIRNLAETLKRHYNRTPPFSRRKSTSASLHDALTLTWIESKRVLNHDSYFLTRDASLSTFSPSRHNNLTIYRNPSIALHALLPWLGSISDTEELPETYSKILASQLISIDTKFSLNEFRMLATIGMDCGKMPEDDVKQCLLFLRREARNLNITKAEDREKLHHLVKGFFSSPDRKYLAEMSELREELDQTKNELLLTIEQNDIEKNKKDTEIRGEKTVLLRYKTKVRLGFSLFIFLSLSIIGVKLCFDYGSGLNLLQKIGSLFWIFPITTSISFIMMRLLTKGEMWPYAKEILKVFKKE